MTSPIMNILVMESHSLENLLLADISYYPSGFTIVSPTLEITPPNYSLKTIPFTAQGIEVFNSNSLGITDGTCSPIELPDGIYNLKYSVYPSYKNYVKKTFIRVEKLLEKFDKAYLKLDISQCDLAFRIVERKELDLIWGYINGAIASANNCAEKQAMELYNKADKHLDKFIKTCKCNA